MERSCGILNHISSLPSKYGIGDFGEGALNFIDFLNKSGQKYWQILPLGHTSFGDSPYQCFSSFAGNPLFISPDMLVKKGYLQEKYLNNLPEFNNEKIDYNLISDFKRKIFKKAFENFKKDESYKKFEKENSFWLEDYAIFISAKKYYINKRKSEFKPKSLENLIKKYNKIMSEKEITDCYYGGSFIFWDDEIKNRLNMEKYIKLLKEEIDYNKFLQYIFYSQWQELKKYAKENNVKIIGDVPIFVAFDSADVWANKELFYLNSKGFPIEVAGVPPDYFSKTGQLWGNPLYDWENHKKQDFFWWIKRIEHTLKFVDVIRIDHFRGFDSYYSIPFGEKTAVNGKWNKGIGIEFFNKIKEKIGSLPIIAEDLGDLTQSVYDLRDSLNLPGMKILQFAFSDCKNDYLPHNYDNPNYIVYTGTHDNNTTLGWYCELDERQKDYFRRYLNVDDSAPTYNLIRLAYSSSAKLAIIPIWDILNLSEKHRMNTPGKSGENWQFRYNYDIPESKIKDLLYLKKLFNR